MQYHIDLNLDFKRNNFGGLYIALEGIDAAGKTTQFQKIVEYFQKQGKEVVKVHEPTREGPVGELVHKALRGEVEISPKAMQYLFTADRQVLSEEKIIPSLKEGKVVISDRSFWSSVAYGIADRDGVDYRPGEMLMIALGILSTYHQFVLPDFTFYLEISVDTAVKRLEQMDKGKEIYEKKEKLIKIIKGYEWLSTDKFSKEIITINGEKPVEEVTEEIIQKLT